MESQKIIIRVARAITMIIRSGIRKDWNFPGGTSGDLIIAKGLERMKSLYPYEGMSGGRIIDYLVYQIYRYRNNIAKGNWSLSWIFSDHAVGKYRQQFMEASGKSGMNYYIDLWLDEHGMDRNMLTSMLVPPSNSMKKYVNPVHEEDIKGRFFNKEVGFMLCQSSSTGWNPRSKFCPQCKFGDKCKESTQHRYPEIMRLRMESQQ